MCSCMCMFYCPCFTVLAECAGRQRAEDFSHRKCVLDSYVHVRDVYVFVCVRVCPNIFPCVCVRKNVYLRVYMYVRKYIFVYICTYMYVCILYIPLLQSSERTGRQPAGDLSYRKSVIDAKCFAFTWKEKFEEPNKNTQIKFKDYAAEVFRDLRVLYGVHDHDYLCKLTHTYSDLARILVYTRTHIHKFSIAIGCLCVFILSVSLLFPLNLLSTTQPLNLLSITQPLNLLSAANHSISFLLSHDHLQCAYISGHCSRFKCDQERERECVCVCSVVFTILTKCMCVCGGGWV